MDDRRYYGLDALRGGMMMLGILLHGGMFYIVDLPPTAPLLTDRNTTYLADFMFTFIHSFRMPAFFVLSGFFTSLLVEKRGVWGTYKNRGARVLLPLLAAVVTVLPLTLFFMADAMISARFGTHDIVPSMSKMNVIGREMIAKGFPADQPAILHLWFLYYLLFFYLTIPLCRWLVRCSLPYEQAIKRFVASPFALVVFGLYTTATLWPYRGGEVMEGFVFLKPHIPSLIYYGSFFILGYVFHYYRDILKTFSSNLHWYALLALVLYPLSMYASHLEYTTVGSTAAIHLLAVILHALCTWVLIYLFMGCALRFFDFESPWILYTSQSSYWVYLMHMIPVALASWWLMQFDFPAVLKYLIVVGFATVFCFGTYHYFVQKTWISVFLNGRRFDLNWPWLEVKPLGERA